MSERNWYKPLGGEHHLLPIAAGAGQLLRLGEGEEQVGAVVAVAGDADGQVPLPHGPQQGGGGVGGGAVSAG